MIEQTAVVRRVRDGWAEVEIQRETTCGGCQQQGSCGTAALSRVIGSRSTRVRLANPLHARVGQQVIVGIEDAALVQGSLLLYGLPLLGLIGGAIAGRWLAEAGQLAQMEPFSILAGLLGLTGGGLLARRLSRSPGLKRRLKIQMLRIAGEPAGLRVQLS